MASVFAHVLAPWALGSMLPTVLKSKKLLVLGALVSVLPDADVVAFLLKIPYLHPLGHRGFSHSVLFAVGMGLLMPVLFFREHRLRSRDGFLLWLFFFLSSLSHGLLDAMTTGGEGVGFFIPLDNERYFFPFRPIVVSPIGIKRFFSEWGLRVLSSELIWVGIPALNIYIGQLLCRRLFAGRKDPA